ncbi:MAG TPA: DUF4231 domain-containing protein [Pseudonocardiaceae bacterium]|jgi:hypothetical protein
MRTTGEQADPWTSPDPALAVALRELAWYERNANRARLANRISEILLLVLSAATTVAAALSAPAWLTASLAAAALVITGVRKTADWHENWVSFRARWSELRTFVNQYRLLPDAQHDDDAKRQLLARVDEIVSSDMGDWAARRRTIETQTRKNA